MRGVRIGVAAGVLAIASLGLTTSGVFAYGRADNPQAQIEFSANCNSPTFELCQEVGLGGIWLWIEIDEGGTADVAGAGCGHIRGVGGGAGKIVGEFPWSWSETPQGLDVTFGSFAGDENGWYNVAVGPETFSFPVTVGHYSSHPVPAVAVETQVAP